MLYRSSLQLRESAYNSSEFNYVDFRMHGELVVNTHTKKCAQYAQSSSELSRVYTGLKSQSGVSLLETFVVLVMLSLLSSIALNNLKSLYDPLQSASALTTSFFKEARAKAISQTLAFHVKPSGNKKLVTDFATNCTSTTRTNDPSLTLNLPTGVTLSSTSWDICFTSRGLSTSNTTIQINEGSISKQIEVMLGGGVRVL
jgi:Tfp pilus assembly protein FimT